MRIQNNVPALNAHRNYSINATGVSKSIAKLSSGYRINSAADDAAGLAISEKMRAQIRGLTMASKNTQDGISLIQTAEGGLQEIDNMLQRIRELVVYASNDTQEHNELSTGDRQKIQDEINALVEEIDSMSERVEFNKKTLLNGDCGVSSDPAKAAAVAKARADYNSSKATVGAYQTQIATDEKTYSNLIDKISSAINSMRTDGLAIYAIADNGVAAEMQSFAGALDDFMTSLSAIGKTGSSSADTEAILSTTASLEEALDSLSDAIVMLSTNATATGLASRIKGNADKIDGYLASLGSALNRLNGDDGASSDATSARYNLTEAQTSLTTAEADLRTAKQDVASAGNGGTPLYFQVGANANQGITVSIDAVTSLELGIGDGNGSSTIDVLADSGTEITNQLDILDEALSYVTTQRSRLGAVQNRMEYTQSSLEISAENLTNAESRIRDVDMAKEMTNFTKMNILYQASTAMLAQANALPQGVLQMLG